MSVDKLEDVLLLPSELLENWSGIALDIGGSLAKLAYRSKENYQSGKPLSNESDADGMRRVSLASCDSEHFSELFVYIHEHCDVTSRDGELPVVPCTGVGSLLYNKQLEEGLNVTLAIQNEFDCIALATCYIVNNVPRDELVSEISQECMRAIKPSVDVFSQALNILRSCSDGAVPETSENLITEKDGRLQINMKDDSPDDKYPILLVIHGSLTSFLKIDKDGSFTNIGYSFYGARAFQGLGSLAAGAESFEELMSLAARGKHDNVDVMSEDTKSLCADTDNLYARLPDGVMFFAHGKAVNRKRELFKQEDIAASLLNGSCINQALAIHLTALYLKISNIVLVGNFVTPDIVKQFLTKEMLMRMCLLQQEFPIRFNFIKLGGHLGSIGALLKYIEVQKS